VARELGLSRAAESSTAWLSGLASPLGQVTNAQVLDRAPDTAVAALARSLGRTMGQFPQTADMPALRNADNAALSGSGWHGLAVVDSFDQAGMHSSRPYPAVPTHALLAAANDPVPAGAAGSHTGPAPLRSALLFTADRIADDDAQLRVEMLGRTGLFHPRYDTWFGALDTVFASAWSSGASLSPATPEATAFLDGDAAAGAELLRNVARLAGSSAPLGGHFGHGGSATSGSGPLGGLGSRPGVSGSDVSGVSTPFDPRWAQEAIATLRQRIPVGGSATHASATTAHGGYGGGSGGGVTLTPSASLRHWLLMSTHVPSMLALAVTHSHAAAVAAPASTAGAPAAAAGVKV